MNNKFVKTTNYKKFVTLMGKLKNLPDNIPRLALIYSEPGIGKTHMLLKWAMDNDAIYVRANNGMTQPGLLRTIVNDLDLTDYHNMQTNLNQIVKSLQQEPRVIIVDEVDYLIGDKNVIEILRDIQDMTNVPIILSGMEFVNRKIARFKHIKSRLYKSLKLKYYDFDEISEILVQLTNLKFSEDAIKCFAMRKTPFRQIVQTIQELESYAQTNNINNIDESKVIEVLNERQDSQIMSQNA
ncbi:ATP-binding protein [bacterium]|nr:ATP-binding protein [bacterium]